MLDALKDSLTVEDGREGNFFVFPQKFNGNFLFPFYFSSLMLLLYSFLLANKAVNFEIKISISSPGIKWLHYYFLLFHRWHPSRSSIEDWTILNWNNELSAFLSLVSPFASPFLLSLIPCSFQFKNGSKKCLKLLRTKREWMWMEMLWKLFIVAFVRFM